MFVICQRWDGSSGEEPDVVAAAQLFIGEMKQVVGRRRKKFARRLR